jgi:hypothetical protein
VRKRQAYSHQQSAGLVGIDGDGLNRLVKHDSSLFKLYDKDDQSTQTLTDNAVIALCEDSRSNL